MQGMQEKQGCMISALSALSDSTQARFDKMEKRQEELEIKVKSGPVNTGSKRNLYVDK